MIMPSLFQFLDARKATLGVGKVTPDQLPQTHPLPALMIELNGDDDEMLLDGSVFSLHQALVTVNCYDSSMLTAFQVAERVKTAMVGYLGTFGAVEAKWIRKESETEAAETDTGLRGVALTFLIAYG